MVLLKARPLLGHPRTDRPFDALEACRFRARRETQGGPVFDAPEACSGRARSTLAQGGPFVPGV